jgi:tripartite-type tricarboxylate transporter receptor subunit TctC
MVINPAVYEKLSYDTMRDFKPVSELGSFPLILIVNAKSPFKSLADLVAYAKANPDKANYSSSSAAFQLATELFKQKTGVPMQMIPYKGRQRFRDRGDLGRSDRDHRRCRAGDQPGQWRHGPRAGGAAPTRAESLPDVPTMKEAGADVEAVLWSGIFVPRRRRAKSSASWRPEFIRIARLPELSPASNCSTSIRSAIPPKNFRASSRPISNAGRRSRAPAISRSPSRRGCAA